MICLSSSASRGRGDEQHLDVVPLMRCRISNGWSKSKVRTHSRPRCFPVRKSRSSCRLLIMTGCALWNFARYEMRFHS